MTTFLLLPPTLLPHHEREFIGSFGDRHISMLQLGMSKPVLEEVPPVEKVTVTVRYGGDEREFVLSDEDASNWRDTIQWYWQRLREYRLEHSRHEG